MSNDLHCLNVMKLEFSRQLFEKYSNIKFHENSPNWIRDGQTDGSTDGEI